MIELLTVPMMLRERIAREEAKKRPPSEQHFVEQIATRNKRVQDRYNELQSLRRTGEEFSLSHEMVRKIISRTL